MSFTLYQKYRPKNFSEITGQEHIVRTLSGSIKNNRLSHAYLFTGSRGIGKTTLARIFAKAINCLEPQMNQSANQMVSIEPCEKCQNCQTITANKTIDLIEIDAASHTGVDNIRQLKENAQVPPSQLKYKVYIIDEVHMLSIGAFNALLKTLEEPPRHAVFILATTEIHKIPETIISRCQRFDFKRLSIEQIAARLRQIAEKESVEIEPEALELIALEAEGGMRDAESILGQIISIEDKNITAKEVVAVTGSSSKKSVFEFTISFLNRDIQNTLEKISGFQTDGINFKNVHGAVINFLRDILLAKANPDNSEKAIINVSPEQKEEVFKIAKKISYEDLIFAIELLQKNLGLFRETSVTQLPLELSSVEFYLRGQLQNETPSDLEVSADTEIETKKEIAKEKSKAIDNKKEIIEKETSLKKEKKDGSSADGKAAALQQPTNLMPSEPDIELEIILDKWSEILEGVKPFNHSIHAFLKNCVPLAINKGQLFIKTKYDFYKERLSEMNNQLTIKKVVDKITGCSLRITILTEKEAGQMSFRNDSSNENHNILHDAMQMLGGRIVE